jgi:Xaa-Pro aminopeptidase
MKVPLTELNDRLSRFKERMNHFCPDWELSVITGLIPQYYFTGTMQDGLLLIPRCRDPVFWVRQSYERAGEESHFPDIRKMRSYRDIAADMVKLPSTVYVETTSMTLAQQERLKKYLPFVVMRSLDEQLAAVRAVKSRYELSLAEHSGEIHRHVLEECVPDMLTEGIDEVAFGCDLYSLMVHKGHQGVVRFSTANEMLLGQIAFGTSSLNPTFVNSAGGISGMHPSTPLMGSRMKQLQKGDLVFVDIGCGYRGYQTDKTQTYMFGKGIPEDAIAWHEQCVDIQDFIVSRLKPGEIPSAIYRDVMAELRPEFLDNFMGYGKHKVRFLGHGIGLWIDEYPVIAEGFDEPLQEGMVLAVEPKKGIPEVGMVGIENTFVVSPQGGRPLTGRSRGLIEVF